jgi:hypothetical protein
MYKKKKFQAAAAHNLGRARAKKASGLPWAAQK